MSRQPLESYRHQALRTRPYSDAWEQVRIRTTPEVVPLLDAITKAMAVEDYPESDVYGMRLALEEAIVNAIKHGHRDDPSLQVCVSYRINSRRALVQIEDAGPGFDPHQVADPCAAENLDRPCGRGLLLMRHYATWIRYNQRGNCVALCKYRSNHESHSPLPSEGLRGTAEAEENRGMHDPIKFAARFLAYSWFRRNYPHASHQRAWKFSGENWNAFLLQALENRNQVPRSIRPLVPIG